MRRLVCDLSMSPWMPDQPENLCPLDDDRVNDLLDDPATHVFICDLKGMEDGIDKAFADVCRGASVNWSTLKAETQQAGGPSRDLLTPIGAIERIPAIADEHEWHQAETVFGRQSFGRKVQFRRPIPAGAVAARRRHGQGGVVSPLCGGRAAGGVRPRRAELGHRQQGLRA
jgi:hypothetical protein